MFFLSQTWVILNYYLFIEALLTIWTYHLAFQLELKLAENIQKIFEIFSETPWAVNVFAYLIIFIISDIYYLESTVEVTEASLS